MYRVGIHNVQNTPDIPRADVVKCGRITRNKCDVALLQEIRDGHDAEDFKAGLGSEWEMRVVQTPNPIAFRTDKFELTPERELPPGFSNRGYLRMHPGDGDIPTPPRFVTWVILSFVGRPSVPPVAFVNGHLINKAWNGREKDPAILQQRRELWYEGYDEWQWCVNNFRKHGLTVLWGGDYNQIGNHVFNLRQDFIGKGGIDQLYVSRGRGPKAAKYRYGDKKEYNTPSDHNLLVVPVNFLVP
jgi:hypothetical protein